MLKRLPGNSKSENSNSPFILSLIRKCQKYGIPYDLMCRLNYNDLLYLVIEYDIESVKSYLKQLRQQQLDKRNIDVVEASPEMTTQFFMKGGKLDGRFN